MLHGLLPHDTATYPQVYQRQIMKSDLASATMVSGSSAAGLSQNELKQLFSLELGTECATKQLLQSCKAGDGVVWLTLPEAGAAAGGAAGNSSSSSIPSALAAAVAAGSVTAINKELQPGDIAVLQQQQAAEAEATDPGETGGGSAANRAGVGQAGVAAMSSCGLADDVDQLEVDWEDDD